MWYLGATLPVQTIQERLPLGSSIIGLSKFGSPYFATFIVSGVTLVMSSHFFSRRYDLGLRTTRTSYSVRSVAMLGFKRLVFRDSGSALSAISRASFGTFRTGLEHDVVSFLAPIKVMALKCTRGALPGTVPGFHKVGEWVERPRATSVAMVTVGTMFPIRTTPVGREPGAVGV